MNEGFKVLGWIGSGLVIERKRFGELKSCKVARNGRIFVGNRKISPIVCVNSKGFGGKEQSLDDLLGNDDDAMLAFEDFMAKAEASGVESMSSSEEEEEDIVEDVEEVMEVEENDEKEEKTLMEIGGQGDLLEGSELSSLKAPFAKQAETGKLAEEERKRLLDTPMSEPEWYFLQTKFACENAVKTSLENMANNDRLVGSRLRDVVVPVKPVVKYNKAGRPTQKSELIFPGYVLVYLSMDKHCYNEISRVPHVQCFVGDQNRERELMSKSEKEMFRPPIPLGKEEVAAIFTKIQSASAKSPEIILSFSPGELVEVKDGPFKGSEARVTEVDDEKQKVTVELQVFGRESPAQFGFRSLKKSVFEDSS